MFFKWEMILLAVIWKSLEIGSDFFFLEIATHTRKRSDASKTS